MTNFQTLRKQVHLDDERQILSPAELAEGARIGLVQYFPGASVRERLAQAAFSLTGVVGDQQNGRIAAAKQGWQHRGLQGVAPLLIANVMWAHEGRARLNVTAATEDNFQSLALINQDVEELPRLYQPESRIVQLSDLGLMAIQPMISFIRPAPFPDEVGRWQPRATLLLDQER